MIIEPDLHVYEGHKYAWSAERRRAAWAASVRLFQQTLEQQRVEQVILMVGIPGAGKSTYARAVDRDDVVVLDSTFVEPERRWQIMQIARQFAVPVMAVWMDTEWDICVKRNAERGEDRRVPIEVMQEMYQSLFDERPREEEGFVDVRRVYTRRSGQVVGDGGVLRKAG
jgi:predicted kinase